MLGSGNGLEVVHVHRSAYVKKEFLKKNDGVTHEHECTRTKTQSTDNHT